MSVLSPRFGVLGYVQNGRRVDAEKLKERYEARGCRALTFEWRNPFTGQTRTYLIADTTTQDLIEFEHTIQPLIQEVTLLRAGNPRFTEISSLIADYFEEAGPLAFVEDVQTVLPGLRAIISKLLDQPEEALLQELGRKVQNDNPFILPRDSKRPQA